MSSKLEPVLDPKTQRSGDNAQEQDPWERAWDSLSDVNKKKFGRLSSSRLEALISVCGPRSASPKKLNLISTLLICLFLTRFKKPQKAARMIVSKKAGNFIATQKVKKSSSDTCLRRFMYGLEKSSRSLI